MNTSNISFRVFKSLVLGFLLSSSVLFVQAQERTISGVVTSVDDPEGVPGASVTLEGTNVGTVTDVSGNYSLSIPDGHSDPVLIFSAISYLEQRVSVGEQATVDVQLEVFAEEIDEVVVTAYSGAGQSRRSITGSVGFIEGKDIQEQQVFTIGHALEGRIPGVRVQTTSGIPGVSPVITIRGVATLSSSASPLIVIDGIPSAISVLEAWPTK